MSGVSEILPGLFEPPSDPGRRSDVRRAKRRRKKRRRKRVIVTVLLLLAVIGGGTGGAYVGLAPIIRKLMEPKDYVGTGSGRVQVQIPTGASGRMIAQVLFSAGVVKTEVAFTTAFQANPKASSIQPGTYALRLRMSGASALALLLDPASRLEINLTIPEGARADNIFTQLARALDVPKSKVVEASRSGAIGLPAAAGGRPEGFLFPATYTFEPSTTPVQALAAMVARGQRAYQQLGISDSRLRKVIIEASIVQAEAGSQKYMGPVARVLDNRLAINMPLQLDSTVSYAVQRFGVTTTPAERRSTSHYNTYRYPGLPFGPISNPGEEAIQAVLNPTPGKWLYFVAVNPSTGETKFAVTGAQHDEQTKEFQAWLRAHPS